MSGKTFKRVTRVGLLVGVLCFTSLFVLTLVVSSAQSELVVNPPSYLPLILQHMDQSTATASSTPTPGLVTPSNPSGLLISEVMYDPSGEQPAGEWVELYNSGERTVFLSDYKLGDEETRGGREGMVQFPQEAVISPGQAIVVANQADTFVDVYAYPPDFEISDSDSNVPDMRRYVEWAGGSMNFAIDGDEVLLLDGDDNLVDALSWGNSSFAFDPPVDKVQRGNSLERFPPSQDTDSAFDWREQSEPHPGEVDLSTPTPTPTPTSTSTPTPTSSATPTPTQTGTPTNSPTATQVPTLVINEIHADPDPQDGDANGDGIVDVYEDEFLEIVNASGIEVDISGWTLEDNFTERHRFPPGSVIPAWCGVVVFGGGAPSGEFGGSLIQISSTGMLGFNNDGDTLILYDLTHDAILTQIYGAEGGDNQSLTRDPDITGANFVKHSLATGSGGALYSPGTRVDGTIFEGCP